MARIWNSGWWNEGMWDGASGLHVTIAVDSARHADGYLEQGTKVITGTITDAVSGAPVASPPLELHVRRPDGPVTVIVGDDLANTATGTYVTDIALDERGPWQLQWRAVDGSPVSRIVLIQVAPTVEGT